MNKKSRATPRPLSPNSISFHLIINTRLVAFVDKIMYTESPVGQCWATMMKHGVGAGGLILEYMDILGRSLDTWVLWCRSGV